MPGVSDRLSELSERVKSAEEAVDAAKTESRDELAARVERVRAEADQRAKDLWNTEDSTLREVSGWWKDIQARWKDHVRTVRHEVQIARDERTASRLQRRVDHAEANAEFSVAFAMTAIEEAEYAVLDATLARAEANDAAG
jgi:hypothetical protein